MKKDTLISKENINSLDSFYTFDITNKYIDIRNLSQTYSEQDAQLDNCFVVGSSIHNDYLYSQFISDYGLWKSSFIRTVDITEDGNITIFDVLYDADLSKIFVVKDTTRNNSIPDKDKTISLREFSHTGEYEYNGILYWVAFNDSINDENFNTENTCIIAAIN